MGWGTEHLYGANKFLSSAWCFKLSELSKILWQAWLRFLTLSAPYTPIGERFYGKPAAWLLACCLAWVRLLSTSESPTTTKYTRLWRRQSSPFLFLNPSSGDHQRFRFHARKVELQAFEWRDECYHRLHLGVPHGGRRVTHKFSYLPQVPSAGNGCESVRRFLKGLRECEKGFYVGTQAAGWRGCLHYLCLHRNQRARRLLPISYNLPISFPFHTSSHFLQASNFFLIFSFHTSVFSCPEQLNRWPCHSLTQSVTHSLLLLTYKEQS